MNTTEITLRLLETGMLQFGEFRGQNGYAPLRLHLELLPAYPEFLVQIAQMVGALPPVGKAQRLVAAADTLPLGVSVSLQMGVSLVYSRGLGEPAAFDLVGAYDSGRTAVVLTNILDAGGSLPALIQRVRQVGLHVHAVAGLLDLQTGLSLSDGDIFSVLTLTEILKILQEKALLPAGQIESVYRWIQQQQQPQ
jgi:orotate phosphoribosyltransferase